MKPQRIEMLESRICLSTITVNTLGDSIATDGLTSLREAITQSAATDTITFAPTLLGSIVLSGTELVIDHNLTIDGPDDHRISVSGNRGSRVFKIASGATTTLDGLVIRNGDAGQTPSPEIGDPGKGGGIRNEGTLTVTNCIISDNRAWSDAGIYNIGDLTISRSTISNNRTWYWGAGGIGNVGTARIDHCLIEGNRANHGGGIVNSNPAMWITNSTIRNNIAGETPIPNNTPGVDGYGGGIRSGRLVTITNSTVSGNAAAVAGGGFWVHDPVSATQVTIAGNVAPRGGAMINETEVYFDNSTVTGNIATDPSGGGAVIGGLVLARNSIISGNHAAGVANDFVVDGFDAQSAHNLFGTGADALAGANQNIVGVTNPHCGTLEDNGGPTLTVLPSPLSAAIDAGDNSLVPAGITTDQRGMPRFANGKVDIGAVETQGEFAFIVNGLLQVQGTPAADHVTVARRGAFIEASRNGQTLRFAATQVQRVQIDAGAGDDVISCDLLQLGVAVNAGVGNDRVTGGTLADFLRGEGGKDTIVGGPGTDRIEGNAGNDYLIGGEGHDAIWAGTGDDRIEGNAGKDTIYGQVGNDALFGGSGNDRLDGGGGNDNLSGQAGADRMFGGDGRDRFYARDSTQDNLDGGGGYDFAQVDLLLDQLTTIEQLLA